MRVVVTCTGGRPELFALCRRWVLRQTLPPDRWLVTTDCDDLPHAPEAEVVRIPDSYVPPPCKHMSPALRAITFAMQHIGDDADIVVMEDDDWYGPRYIETLLSAPHWCNHQKTLYQCHLPAEKVLKIETIEEPCEGMLAFKKGHRQRVLDWLVSRADGAKLDSRPLDMQQLVQVKGVGFGLPGRTGATRKHVPDHRKVKNMRADPGSTKFRQLLGADADAYLSLLSR